MHFKILILGSTLFLLACDSNNSTSEAKKYEHRQSMVDSLAALPKEVAKVSPTLENDVEYKKAVKRDAEQMNAHFVKKQFNSFVKYASPVLVTKLGGEAAMIVALKDGFKEMEAAGNKLKKIVLEEPNKIIAMGDELQTTIGETLEMKVPRGLVITKSVLIAISKDGGKTWTFIDTSGKDLKTLRTELAGLSEELIIPPHVQPKLLELTDKIK